MQIAVLEDVLGGVEAGPAGGDDGDAQRVLSSVLDLPVAELI